MSTSSISTTPTSTRHSRLLAHTFLLISTNSLTLCLLYTLQISPSKQHFGFSAKLAVLQISWLVASGLVLVVSLCYLVSSYYRGHQRRMVAAAAGHDLERRPASTFSRALELAGGGRGRNPPSPTLVLEGGGMDVVREKERRHGPVYYTQQKPLPPNPPAENGDEDEDEKRRRAEPWQRTPGAAAAAASVVDNLLRVPRNPLIRPGTAIYPGYNTDASAILPFGQVNVSSGGGAPGVRVGAQGGAVDDDNDNESVFSSQPLYANSELRGVIGRYL
ncbi:hypothetical protein C7212DRAFT_361766 [Tuber magnatum]|uniref:Uncharacterized protein n=1 Tax=Tuber magnatum TaxID=42249 RepID=A0A317SYH5_9PEZI|nr:hypothetical protein C7212DRAFT_361766 [Tuber magnatum]